MQILNEQTSATKPVNRGTREKLPSSTAYKRVRELDWAAVRRFIREVYNNTSGRGRLRELAGLLKLKGLLVWAFNFWPWKPDIGHPPGSFPYNSTLYDFREPGGYIGNVGVESVVRFTCLLRITFWHVDTLD